jgi:hypothetical protein
VVPCVPTDAHHCLRVRALLAPRARARSGRVFAGVPHGCLASRATLIVAGKTAGAQRACPRGRGRAGRRRGSRSGQRRSLGARTRRAVEAGLAPAHTFEGPRRSGPPFAFVNHDQTDGSDT